ncbi:ethylbenzene dehydrogenase-related protein [Hahella ganghwensis]|uniref:ethylbenzene dehydrogenase-related protein n=1 Tax=Hahella ganghwensis TaxID=286420 RepID=UPI00037FFFA2|nr:ethylbenzene dehydrogenase-related protein [Hahella ganghwensis]
MIFPASHWLRVIVHLFAISLFTVSMASGLRLAVDGDWLLGELWAFIAPQGNVIAWHLGAAVAWIILLLVVVGALRRKWVTLGSSSSRSSGVAISLLYVLLPAQLGSGLALYFGVMFSDLMLPLHYWLSLLLLAIVVLHMLEQLVVRRGRFLPSVFIPAYKASGLGIVLTAGLVGAFFWWGSGAGQQDLYVFDLPDQVRIKVDGDASDEVWTQAPALTVVTSQGNQYQQSVPVRIKAMANQYTAYFLISWPDDTPDYAHLPLVKSSEGWSALHDGFERDDERTFYEDKLAVMISQGNGFAGDNSIHLGKAPLSGYPVSRSGRGFHYTTDGTIRDVWHWKALRGADMSVLDDDHFGPPEAPCAFCPRYKAGYQTDPAEAGGVRQNWEWFRSDGITPLRLPGDTLVKPVDQNAMAWYGSRAYSPELDTLPTGARMPSVLWMSHYEGDRGDVRGRARWQDGVWTLELARARDTGSPYDIVIEDGVFMWVAPFNHAQTRHAYHHRPIRLRMQP